MALLVSLDDVKRVLRVDGDHDEWEIQKIADAASDIVMGYLKKPMDTYTHGTLPPRIERAILEVCVRLFDDREGMWDGTIISPAIQQILHRDRDPALR